ncbi:MAG: beta-ketoacyl-ACP synthase III [Planctomycetota bacterium]
MTEYMTGPVGVEIVGVGTAVPDDVVTNTDLEKVMDTSDEWIRQRTGIEQRYRIKADQGESVKHLAKDAVIRALDAANMDAAELDLIVLSTMSSEMTCPPTACRLAAEIGTKNAGAFDLSAACCGFVFGLNTAYGLMQTGQYRNVALIGADTLTNIVEYSTKGRNGAILFGDAAGAIILRKTNDSGKGIIAQAMHSDGERWADLSIPQTKFDLEDGVEFDEWQLGKLHMNGQSVFKFAVGTFPQVIEQTLDRAGMTAGDVDHFICHQSNRRILEAARKRFGLAKEKFHINIDRFANTVAASVPLALNDLVSAGRVKPGQRVMFVGFGGGLTWGTSLWQL